MEFFQRSSNSHQHQQEQPRTEQHIIYLLFTRILFFSLLVTITFIFQWGGHATAMLPPLRFTLSYLLIIYLFSIGSVLFLQRGKKTTSSTGLFQLSMDSVFTAVMVYGTGCSQSLFTPVFLLPVIAGSVILRQINFLAPAALATLLYGVVLLMECLNILPYYYAYPEHLALFRPYDPLVAINQFALYGVIFFLTALVSGHLARRLETTEKALSQTSLQFDQLSELYKQIFDDIPTGIITTDEKHTITSCNPAAQRIVGYAKETMVGLQLGDILPNMQMEQDQERKVCDHTRQDGEIIRLGYTSSRLEVPAYSCPYGEKSDQTDHVHDSNDPEQNFWQVITLQDISITERMERQVRHAEKMVAIGELSAKVAHDFRTPITAIIGAAELLKKEQFFSSSPAKAAHVQGQALTMLTVPATLLKIILRESQKISQTIDNFLYFAQPDPMQPEWFSLPRLVRQLAEKKQQLYGQLLEDNLIVNIPERLDIWADRQQLSTAMDHLLENAIAAMTQQKDGHMGKIMISIRDLILDHESESPQEHRVSIDIADQGKGIPLELQEKVFSPFFTQNTNHSGLGLALVKNIIKRHGGIIQIQQDEEYTCIMHCEIPQPLDA